MVRSRRLNRSTSFLVRFTTCSNSRHFSPASSHLHKCELQRRSISSSSSSSSNSSNSNSNSNSNQYTSRRPRQAFTAHIL